LNRIHAAPLRFSACCRSGARRQQSRTTVEEIERYRAALGDGNPAELWEARGEDLWKQKRGRRTPRSSAATSASGPAS
jgi:sulfur-oxidizing protein SoxA